MKFVIRDDDLNYFSQPADIERWYADVFAAGIPVGFSTIPLVKPESDVYTGGAAAQSREYPVGENTALVEYVKQHPQIEILQHGTTHETIDGAFEYARQVPRGEAVRGKHALEEAFGTKVTVFVPPHDWIGRAGVLAVEAAGMDILRGRGAGLKVFIARFAYLRAFITMLFFKLSYILRGETVPAYPFILDFGGHKEACSYRLEDADVFRGLEYVERNNGVFVVVTHLHFYTEEKKARLMALIARAHELGAEFVRPSELFA